MKCRVRVTQQWKSPLNSPWFLHAICSCTAWEWDMWIEIERMHTRRMCSCKTRRFCSSLAYLKWRATVRSLLLPSISSCSEHRALAHWKYKNLMFFAWAGKINFLLLFAWIEWSVEWNANDEGNASNGRKYGGGLWFRVEWIFAVLKRKLNRCHWISRDEFMEPENQGGCQGHREGDFKPLQFCEPW